MLNEIFEQCECILDGARGIYIPQAFAECYDMKEWKVSEEDEKILMDGPDNDLYWETWDDVIREAEYTDEDGIVWSLWQDGDLFAVVIPECTK